MLSALLNVLNVEVGQASFESREIDGVIAQQVTSTVPPRLTNYLPEGSNTLRKARACPEWSQWQRALKREKDGQI